MKQNAIGAQRTPSTPATRRGFLGRIGSALRAVVNGKRRFGQAWTTSPHKYESKRKLLGLPLLAINLGPEEAAGQIRHARGVLAIGNRATGVIALGVFHARGVLAVAPTAMGMGVISIAGMGLISVSAFGLGIVSVSAFAVGYVAVGVFALGWKCIGIVAVGYEAIGIIGIGKMVHALFSPWR